MWSSDQANRDPFLPTKAEAAPPCAGRKRKRPLTLAVYDPAAAEERATAATLLPLSERAGALVPFLARPPIDAVPLSFVALPPRAEPPWLRERLGLRRDLAVHFIGEKAVTVADLVGQQNRFRLPTDGVLRVLRPILLDEELDTAKIPRIGVEEAPRAPRKPRPPPPTEEEPQQGGKIETRTKKKGEKHGGLPVDLYNNVKAGVMGLQLTRWQSSHGIVIKGEGYRNFITRCGFAKGDVVEIWAFKQREFRYFGACFLRERPLCVVLTKKKEEQPAPLPVGMGKCTIL